MQSVGTSEGGSGERSRRPAPESPPLRRQLAVGGLVFGLVFALLLAFAAYGAVRDVPYRIFTKEVLEQTGLPLHTGFIATVTWFLWTVAGTAGLIAITLHRRWDRDPSRTLFFGLATVLTGLLFLDDFLQFHDRLLKRIGSPEQLLYTAYAVLLIALLVWFRPQVARGGMLLALGAGAFWLLSIVGDLEQEHLGNYQHFIEDGSKMVGTALWAAFMVWSCFASIETIVGQRRSEQATILQPAASDGVHEQ
jgi:hypothetical protein